MSIEQYTVVANINTKSSELFVATPADITALEKQFSISLDDDYKTYVTKYGCGIMGGTYIRVYLPQTTIALQQGWLDRINQYWFWEAGKEVLSKEQVLQSVIVGDTFDGDEIVFYNNTYYVLPRHDEKIYKIGAHLGEAIQWLCGAGILTEAFSEREFEPFDSAEYLK